MLTESDKIQTLVDALRPFAEFAKRIKHIPDSLDSMPLSQVFRPVIVPTLGDCRRAAEAIKAVGK